MVDTIFAPASGSLPSGVSVIRISGPGARFGLEMIAGGVQTPRRLVLRNLKDPQTGEVIDRGLVVYLPGPGTFTGEDVVELHVHGSRAVVAAMLGVLGRLGGFRPAAPGEFSRRAFVNGRMDLTQAEGLADLIAAETTAQRRQAQAVAEGGLLAAAERWRALILEARALFEADLDFVDEEDVPAGLADGAEPALRALLAEVRRLLAGANRAAQVRDGFRVVILGPPNAGKSSLLNALAGREAAIVTPIAGTTRDVVEVRLEIGGQLVLLSDTAGLRPSDDVVEAEGIRRALGQAAGADLVLWLTDNGAAPPLEVTALGRPTIELTSKCDGEAAGLSFVGRISAATGAGIDGLVDAIGAAAATVEAGESTLLIHARHVAEVRRLEEALSAALSALPIEMRAEALRGAGDAVGRLTGRIDPEEVLGAIFSRFCIGK